MRKQKTLILLLTVILAAALFTGCAGQEPDDTEEVVHKVAVIMEEEKPPLAEEAPNTNIDSNDDNEIDDNEIDIDNNEDDANDSVQWMSYIMSVTIAEEEPPSGDMTPDGRFVHVTMTYISDDEELGGFLFDDIRDKSNFVLIDASGNVYEHLDVFSPVSIILDDGVLAVEDIQEVTGVFYDIPLDIHLSDLTFSVSG